MNLQECREAWTEVAAEAKRQQHVSQRMFFIMTILSAASIFCACFPLLVTGTTFGFVTSSICVIAWFIFEHLISRDTDRDVARWEEQERRALEWVALIDQAE